MFVLPDIGGIPPDTVPTFNSHSIQINAESDFDMLDRVPTTPCGARPIPRGVVQRGVIQVHNLRSGSHPGWNTHHGKVLAT